MYGSIKISIIYLMRYTKPFKKFLSVLLTFILLVNANISVFAQKDQKPWEKEAAELSADIKKNLNIITENDIKRLYKHEYNFKRLLTRLEIEGSKNNYGKVCDGDICAPYHTFVRGVISALLEYTEGDWEVFQNYITEIRNAALSQKFEASPTGVSVTIEGRPSLIANLSRENISIDAYVDMTNIFMTPVTLPVKAEIISNDSFRVTRVDPQNITINDLGNGLDFSK